MLSYGGCSCKRNSRIAAKFATAEFPRRDRTACATANPRTTVPIVQRCTILCTATRRSFLYAIQGLRFSVPLR